jgi:hypothetical protein
VHQVGSIYKIIQGCRSTKHKMADRFSVSTAIEFWYFLGGMLDDDFVGFILSVNCMLLAAEE